MRQVLIFENKGEVVGVSNPHPHGQIYATNFTWKIFDTELEAQRSYHATCGRGLFGDIIAAEQQDGRRILYTVLEPGDLRSARLRTIWPEGAGDEDAGAGHHGDW